MTGAPNLLTTHGKIRVQGSRSMSPESRLSTCVSSALSTGLTGLMR